MQDDRVIRARVTGRVQGVGFRAWTQATAQALGLRGWVRNAEDGSVGALLAGPPGAVDDMVAALHRGPPAARVERVEIGDSDERVAPGVRVLR